MDPLSITASVLTLLQATSQVVSICYNYRSAVNDSSWELPEILEEARSLRSVLEALEPLARKAENTDPSAESRLPTFKLLCSPKGPLSFCLEILKALEQKLAQPAWLGKSGSKRKALAQALRWPLKEAETKKILETLRRLRDILNLALTADQTTLLLAIEETAQVNHTTILEVLGGVSEVQKDVCEVQEGVSKLEKSFATARLDEHTKRLHQWLAAPDSSSNHAAARKKYQATTGSWFLESSEFVDWKSDPGKLLWLYGIPGCGKTILSSTVIKDILQHCQSQSSTAAVYFYFDFNDSEKQYYGQMLRSLIRQLSSTDPIVQQALQTLFDSCMNGDRQPEISQLESTLQRMIEGFQDVYIVLDALDECVGRNELLEGIQTMMGCCRSRLHILTTSRRERDIEDSFDGILDKSDKICLQTSVVDSDIRTYVHERLLSDRRLERWSKDKTIQDEIETVLTENSGGMFRWAVCQLDALCKCLKLVTLRRALSSLPKDLDETYARILKTIPEEYCHDVWVILQWLVHSARPMGIEEVAEAVAIDISCTPEFDINRRFSEPNDLLLVCGSLITTTSIDPRYRAGPRVELAHFSVKEFLVSKTFSIGPMTCHAITEKEANVTIAGQCLAYLRQIEDSQSALLPASHDYPLVQYASEFWKVHTEWIDKDDKEFSLITELFLCGRETWWKRSWILDLCPNSLWKRPYRPTPLFFASSMGLLEVVKSLTDAGVDMNEQVNHYGTALIVSISNRRLPITKWLLQKGADVNAEAENFRTPLEAACISLQLEVVASLLERGAHVNGSPMRPAESPNPLLIASRSANYEIVRMLLGAGANPNVQDWFGNHPLRLAAKSSLDEVIRKILDMGADFNAQIGSITTVLQTVCKKNDARIVDKLLQAGATVNAQNKSGTTALLTACNKNNLWFVDKLLQAGADVNAQNKIGTTALLAACDRNNFWIVDELLQAGADVNAKGGDYGSALMTATVAGNPEIVRRLIAAGADVDLHVMSVNKPFCRALQAASNGGHEEIVRQLIEAGANINTRSAKGGTALWHATTGNHINVVRLLVDNGADVNLVSSNTEPHWQCSETPFYAALRCRHREIAKVLLKAGAELSPDVTTLPLDSIRILQIPSIYRRLSPDVRRQIILCFASNLSDSKADEAQDALLRWMRGPAR